MKAGSTNFHFTGLRYLHTLCTSSRSHAWDEKRVARTAVDKGLDEKSLSELTHAEGLTSAARVEHLWQAPVVDALDTVISGVEVSIPCTCAVLLQWCMALCFLMGNDSHLQIKSDVHHKKICEQWYSRIIQLFFLMFYIAKKQ